MFAIGAVWSSCSPDFGEDAICDRFGQIEPTVLVTTDRTSFMPGVLLAVRRVAELPESPVVGLEHLLWPED